MTDLDCPWRASCRFLAAPPLHPPGTPFLSGCTEPSVCLSEGQGIFLPNPPKTRPALEGFIIMQISRIGSAPAEDSGGGRRTGCHWSWIEPQIRPSMGCGGRVRTEKGLVPVIRPPGEAVGSEGLGTGAAGEQTQAPSLAAECGAGERHSFRILSLCIEPFCDSSVSKYQLRGDLFLTSL